MAQGQVRVLVFFFHAGINIIASVHADLHWRDIPHWAMDSSAVRPRMFLSCASLLHRHILSSNIEALMMSSCLSHGLATPAFVCGHAILRLLVLAPQSSFSS